MREHLDAGLVFVAAAGLVAAALTAFTVPRAFRFDRLGHDDRTLLGGALLIAALVTLCWTLDVTATVALTAASALIVMGIKAAFPRLTIVGALHLAQLPLALIVGAPWAYALLAAHDAPGWVLTLALVGIGVGIVLGGFAFAGNLARQAMLTHADWQRPHRALAPHAARGRPKVSIHLPCYAEPPEVVIPVLDRLARLDYPAFEVLVCDNNTQDEALWRPLERHCARLNRAIGEERFRFFHVAPLPGAKAGALNYCLDRMAADAPLVAVIDADYHARPDFLARLTGFFDDPRIAYVQTPHDYRGHDDSAYLSACYWEYMPSNKVEMPGVNEYGAAFTIGTMCVLRRDALEQAGRWAEWCLTEDSEVSVRLRALGYEGIYLEETFGRGLIPETFDDYKKQRFRWTAGPMQQLRRHWRWYVPVLAGGTMAIKPWSKLLEVQRAVAPIVQLAGIGCGVVGTMLVALLIAGGQMAPLAVPDAAWFAMALGLATAAVATMHRLWLAGCRSSRDMARGELARLSLSYVQMVGGIAGLSARPLAWRRTPKFSAERSTLRALAGTLPETLLGALCLLAIGALIASADVLGRDFAALAGLGAGLLALRFLAAPAMALAGERRLAALRTMPDPLLRARAAA